jgi:hypothetical protein
VDLIEQVGAYVGLAAFLGLAILSLLYFSQARDVRRLREWAGRAPERTGEAGATQHYLPPVPIEQAGPTRMPLRERLRRIRRIHIPAPRYLALAAGAVVIIVAGTLGALQLIGEDEPAGRGGERARGDDRRGGDSGSR